MTPTTGSKTGRESRGWKQRQPPLTMCRGILRPGQAERTPCMVSEVGVLSGRRWAWGWWHTHRSPSVPAGRRHECAEPGQRETRCSKLKRPRPRHLCLRKVSLEDAGCSPRLRLPLARLTAVRALESSVRSRAINWIVKAQDRKMIAAFLQLPGFPIRRGECFLFVLLQSNVCPG